MSLRNVYLIRGDGLGATSRRAATPETAPPVIVTGGRVLRRMLMRRRAYVLHPLDVECEQHHEQAFRASCGHRGAASTASNSHAGGRFRSAGVGLRPPRALGPACRKPRARGSKRATASNAGKVKRSCVRCGSYSSSPDVASTAADCERAVAEESLRHGEDD